MPVLGFRYWKVMDPVLVPGSQAIDDGVWISADPGAVDRRIPDRSDSSATGDDVGGGGRARAQTVGVRGNRELQETASTYC